jgi:hypothetical protein
MGGSNHLGALLFARRSGIEMNHIPYKGNAPAMNDVIGGQLSMMLDIISTASTYIHSGKVRAIAVTSPQRNASLPDVPTFAESGIEGLKGFDVGGWYGVYGPKGMSPELVARLNKSINAALAQPELRKRYKELGYDEWTGAPQNWPSAPPRSAMWATVTQGIVGTDMRSMHAYTICWIAGWPGAERPFIHLPDGSSLSFADLGALADTAEAELRALQVWPGDRVLVVAENCPEHAALILACSRVGAWSCGVNARMAPGEIDAFAAKADARGCTSAASDSASGHARRFGAGDSALAGMQHSPAREAVAEPARCRTRWRR